MIDKIILITKDIILSEKFKITVDKDIEEIVPMFLENRLKDIEQLKAFIEQQDITQIEVISHKLAGNAGSYGFTDLGLIGAKMEQACKDKDMNEIQNKFQEFVNYMNNLEVEYA